MNDNSHDQLIMGDCLEIMKDIPDNSIDSIITDLPYNITRSKWDSEINLQLFWNEIERITEKKAPIITTSSQPFTSILTISNLDLFKYEIIWEKSRGSNFIHSKFRPIKTHENILVFSKSPSAYNKLGKSMTYNPQMTDGKPYDKGIVQNDSLILQGNYKYFEGKNEDGKRYPRSVIYFSSDSDGNERGLHPTQKPIKLFEYLVKMFSNEGDTVLDCCAGSGTTAIACMNTNRRYICIEKEPKYFEIMENRIKQHQPKLEVFTHG